MNSHLQVDGRVVKTKANHFKIGNQKSPIFFTVTHQKNEFPPLSQWKGRRNKSQSLQNWQSKITNFFEKITQQKNECPPPSQLEGRRNKRKSYEN